MSILVVDDSCTMRRLVIKVLTRIGLQNFIEAGTVTEAIKKISERDFHLCIVDVNMPGMSGLNLVQYIKANEKYKDITVLVLSSESAKTDIDKALDIGANEYLCKPFSHEDLQLTVRKLVT